MTLAPIYKRFSIEKQNYPGFGIVIGKTYLSYSVGHGITFHLFFFIWNLKIVLWKLRKDKHNA